MNENLHHPGTEEKDVLRLVVLVKYKITLLHGQLRRDLSEPPERGWGQALQKWNTD
jgi:hypothetical protein